MGVVGSKGVTNHKLPITDCPSSARIAPVLGTHASTRTVILASSSPRRRELLALGGLRFQVRPAAADETALPGEAPLEFVQRMSRTKARLVAAGAEPGAVVIGADTIVVLDESSGAPSILGKPRDAAQAAEMLRRRRGRMHRVLTGVTVIDSAARHDWGWQPDYDVERAFDDYLVPAVVKRYAGAAKLNGAR